MKNSINNPQERPSNTSSNLLKMFTIISLCTLLTTSCYSPETKIQRQREEVERLTNKLKRQSENYHEVARQQNIQIDIREEGADATINQEIGYATDWAKDYDEKIAKTKENLARAQGRLAKLEEEYNVASPSSNSNYGKLNPNKYDYIPEEFNRASK